MGWLSGGQKTRLGDAEYPIHFLSDVKNISGTATPCFVQAGDRFMAEWMLGIGSVESVFQSMIDKSKQFGVPMVASASGNIVIVD